MTTLNFEKVVNGNKDDIWQVLADFAGISIFNPSVPKSYAINGSGNTGLGAQRRCELSNDGAKFVEERIIRYVDGKEYDVEIYGGNQMPPVNNFIVTIGMEHVSGNQYRIYFIANYQPKFGPIGAVMNMAMIKPLLSKAFDGILIGFKHHMETGQPVQSFGTLKAAGLIA